MKTALSFLILPALVIILFTSEDLAQSQSLNGQIEGTVTDRNGAAIPNARLTATNLETGAIRSSTTSENGVYRFAILPLGNFRLTAEAINYKKAVREGITVTTGQPATVDLALDPGEITEIVTVTADSAIADVGKTHLGRVMTEQEVQSLPLVSRNFHNFALLQPNVTGRPGRAVGNFPTVNANGFARRINFQLDGNRASLAGIADNRMIVISETYVDEVQLVTNGFAAEFGNTPGIIINVVTPSGTNALSGSATYRFRIPAFYTRPFYYQSPIDLPDNRANHIALTAGGPIIKDKWQWYLGYEIYQRDDSTWANRLSKISAADRTDLIAAGLPGSIFVPSIPTVDEAASYIAKTDLDLNSNNHLAVRINFNQALLQNYIPGQFNTLERSIDLFYKDGTMGLQLVSFKGDTSNEFRTQFAHHVQDYRRNSYSGSGPTVTIPNRANFGSPDSATINPEETATQMQDNLSWTSGQHSAKVGGGFSFISNFQRAASYARYTFATVQDYINARNGSGEARRRYTSYEQTFGDPESRATATFWNVFAQDDWKMTRRLKVNFGLRYDLYVPPEADPSAPLPQSRKFNIDKNNFAPRLGVAYSVQEGVRPLVLRIGAGLYYETPWLNMYQRALARNGSPRFSFFRLESTDEARPSFPEIFSGPPPNRVSTDVNTVSPEFENLYAIHSNVELEKAITSEMSLAVGYVHSAGRHISVYQNVNVINPARLLADGRGVYNQISNALPTRRYPDFNVILMAESGAVSQYDALTVTLRRRFSRGIQFNINYTLSNGVDDAPEQNLFTVPAAVLNDPYNRHLDWGNSYADQLHTFTASGVVQPSFRFENRWLDLIANRNQVSFILTANSGERFSILADRDLDRDGIIGNANSDRPIGIERNSGKTPPQFNLDLRYSRLLRFGEHVRLDLFAEFTNILNINSIVQYGDLRVPTNPDGEIIGPMPDFKTKSLPTSQESRQIQLGVKVQF